VRKSGIRALTGITSNDGALTGYLQAVKAALQQRGIAADTITSFEQNAQNYVKTELLPKFRDLEFYTGESMNPDGLYESPFRALAPRLYSD
jgi:hypothetical protein